MSIWERFNEIEGANTEAVEEQKSLSEPFKAGEYKVKLESYENEFGDVVTFEASETKQTGLPMAKARFRVIEGERKNGIIFYNQVIQNPNYPNITAMNIAKLTSLLSGILGESIEFTSLVELANLFTRIDEGIEFTLEISYTTAKNGKEYPEYRVIKDIEDLETLSPITDDDIPF